MTQAAKFSFTITNGTNCTHTPIFRNRIKRKPRVKVEGSRKGSAGCVSRIFYFDDCEKQRKLSKHHIIYPDFKNLVIFKQKWIQNLQLVLADVITNRWAQKTD